MRTMEGRLVERLTIRSVLLSGFGLMLGLWLFAGYQVTERLQKVQRDGAAVSARYQQAQELLASVRTQVLVASVLLRDSLLDPDANAQADDRQAIERAYSGIDTLLTQYVPFLDSAAEREREAARHLDAAAKKGGTEAGQAARLIVAARSEKPAEVVPELTRIARDGTMEVAANAELDAARLLAATGKTTEAIERLKRAIESPRAAAPKDALLFVLAETYEKAGNAGDARSTYQRIVNDYPNSPYRTPAREKLGS